MFSLGMHDAMMYFGTKHYFFCKGKKKFSCIFNKNDYIKEFIPFKVERI